MKDLDNLREVAVLSPDFVGFIFYARSPRYVEPGSRVELLRQVPQNVEKVGVFVNEMPENIKSEAKRLNLDFIQLHGSESPELCRELKAAGLGIIKAFGIDEEFDFSMTETYKPHVDYFLFDTKTSKHGGSGKTFNWKMLDNYDQEIPFFLSGGIDLDQIAKMEDILHYNLKAIDVNSRFETSPGHKDIAKLKALKSSLDQFNKKYYSVA